MRELERENATPTRSVRPDEGNGTASGRVGALRQSAVVLHIDQTGRASAPAGVAIVASPPSAASAESAPVAWVGGVNSVVGFTVGAVPK